MDSSLVFSLLRGLYLLSLLISLGLLKKIYTFNRSHLFFVLIAGFSLIPSFLMAYYTHIVDF
jgi:hypothetical protein